MFLSEKITRHANKQKTVTQNEEINQLIKTHLTQMLELPKQDIKTVLYLCSICVKS